MTLARWDPFREMVSLRDAMDRLFEESFILPRRLFGEVWSGMVYQLPVDVYETADEYVVEAVIPGIPVDKINIEFQEGALTISGEVPRVEPEGATYHLRERWYGRFQRTLTFPTAVDADKIEATLENGVLRVHLPKTAEARPKQIRVKAVR
ncbi:MAG: Hsp20/alpha crystallin family protein [Ardenticatenia bacterium]|nr:Hsp20/alpha crystallin family protein [Ardenticatenia bacterium]